MTAASTSPRLLPLAVSLACLLTGLAAPALAAPAPTDGWVVADCDHGAPERFDLPPVPVPRERDVLNFTASRLDERLDAEVVTASGSVRATLGELVLTGRTLVFDRRRQRGALTGDVHVAGGAFRVSGDRVDLDAASRSFTLGRFRGQAVGQGNFWGDALHVSPDGVVARGVGFSACRCVDPGYFYTASRVTYRPPPATGSVAPATEAARATETAPATTSAAARPRGRLEARDVTFRVGGVPLLYLPVVATEVGDDGRLHRDPWWASWDLLPWTLTGGQGHPTVHVTGGLDPVEGFFGTATVHDDVAPGHVLDVPVHLSQNHGPSAFAFDHLASDSWTLDTAGGWASPWTVGQGGPSAWTVLANRFPGVRVTAAGGYRTPIGGRYVHQLPQLGAAFSPLAVGPLSLTPSLDAGYLVEELAGPKTTTDTHALKLDEGLGASIPIWSPFPEWLSGTLSGGEGYARYPGTDQGQGSVSGNLYEQLKAGPARSYVNYGSTLHWGSTPFGFDNGYPFDQLGFGASVDLLQAWNLGVDVANYRPRDYATNQPLGPMAYVSTTFNLGYHVNCLWWRVHVATYLPPTGGQPRLLGFSYEYDVSF